MPHRNDKPLVSIILFSYNQENFITEAVESLLNQTYSPLEIILSDDCSKDDTFNRMKRLAKAYKGPHKVKLNHNKKNLGVIAHMNKALNLTKGELIFAAAGDDISLPERCEKVVSYWLATNKKANLIANPGCYPTAVQLGFMPLLEAGVIDPTYLIADAKSGASGAGRKAEVHALLAEAGDNFKAYGVAGHRHLPEISQGLASMANTQVGLTFTPHLLPMIRGIHATLYAKLTKSVDLQQLFEDRYREEAFVDVLPSGSHPETRSVRGSNQCRIAVHQPQGSDTVVILSVIDNLVKGAAGQAVQNMNIMFGLSEGLGLNVVPLLP